jgi:hypothetical protein
MSTQDQCRAAKVPLGSNGEVLTADTLPSPRLKRWVAGRKAEVLAAVDCGLLSVDEACARYGISLDEFLSWNRAVERAGLRGLSVKRVQDHRPRRVERTRKCW